MNFISSVASAAFRNSAQSRKGSKQSSRENSRNSNSKMSESSDSEMEAEECDREVEQRKNSTSDSDSISSSSRPKRSGKKLFRQGLGSREKSNDKGTDMNEEGHKSDKNEKQDAHKSDVNKAESSSNTSSNDRKVPPIGDMVQNAILSLKDRKGSSAEAIKKFVLNRYELDEGKYSPYIKRYLRKAVGKGDLVQFKGQGGNGAFKLSQAFKQRKTEMPHKAASAVRLGMNTRPSRVPARNFSMIQSFKPKSQLQSRFKESGRGIIKRPSRRTVSFVAPIGRLHKPPKAIRQTMKSIVAKRGRPAATGREQQKMMDQSVRMASRKKEAAGPSRSRPKARNS